MQILEFLGDHWWWILFILAGLFGREEGKPQTTEESTPAEPEEALAGMEFENLCCEAGGRCGVCETPVMEDLVECRKCRTPHHETCWGYAGLCSVYGCGETTFAPDSSIEDERVSSSPSTDRSPPPLPVDCVLWICPRCSQHNESKFFSCPRCWESENAVVLRDQANPQPPNPRPTTQVESSFSMLVDKP